MRNEKKKVKRKIFDKNAIVSFIVFIYVLFVFVMYSTLDTRQNASDTTIVLIKADDNFRFAESSSSIEVIVVIMDVTIVIIIDIIIVICDGRAIGATEQSSQSFAHQFIVLIVFD